MKKIALSVALICAGFSTVASAKIGYTYTSVIQFRYPNDSFNSGDIEAECQSMGGKVLAKKTVTDPVSADSTKILMAVCKVPVEVED